jgi:hypothetical protein
VSDEQLTCQLTLDDLVQKVPAEWSKCELAIARIGNYNALSEECIDSIERISLHEDQNGRRVLLLHKNPAPKTDKWTVRS